MNCSQCNRKTAIVGSDSGLCYTCLQANRDAARAELAKLTAENEELYDMQELATAQKHRAMQELAALQQWQARVVKEAPRLIKVFAEELMAALAQAEGESQT